LNVLPAFPIRPPGNDHFKNGGCQDLLAKRKNNAIISLSRLSLFFLGNEQ
jgi:hypothetical protein